MTSLCQGCQKLQSLQTQFEITFHFAALLSDYQSKIQNRKLHFTLFSTPWKISVQNCDHQILRKAIWLNRCNWKHCIIAKWTNKEEEGEKGKCSDFLRVIGRDCWCARLAFLCLKCAPFVFTNVMASKCHSLQLASKWSAYFALINLSSLFADWQIARLVTLQSKCKILHDQELTQFFIWAMQLPMRKSYIVFALNWGNYKISMKIMLSLGHLNLL